MKTLLVVVVALCLVQSDADMSQGDVNTALATLNKLFLDLIVNIKKAQASISEYHDSATNYTEQYKKLQQEQINSTQKLIDVAIAEAQMNVSSNDTGAIACFARKQIEARNLTMGIIKESVRCPGTKLYEIGDMALKMTTLANTTINIIPDANIKVAACTKRVPWEILGCIGDVTARTTDTVGQAILQITNLVNSANTFVNNLPTDLKTCLDVKMINFKLMASRIPVAIGMCLGKAILA